MVVNNNARILLRSSFCSILLLLVVLILPAAPLAAQATPTPAAPRPSCKNDTSVMWWDEDAPSGTVFTMTKDCDIKTGSDINHLLIKNGKTFIIDGAGNSIFPADKSAANNVGTAIGFENGANIVLVLRNLTIDGGGDAATPTGGDLDPVIVLQAGTLILDRVTVKNNRGGSIRMLGAGTIILKGSTFTENQLSGALGDNESTVVNMLAGGTVFLQNRFDGPFNAGGAGLFRLKGSAFFDMHDATCIDTRGSTSKGGSLALFDYAAAPEDFINLWGVKASSRRCGSVSQRPQGLATPPAIPTFTATPTPTPTPPPSSANGNGGNGDEMMAMGDPNYGRRIKGTVGSASAYYHSKSGGVLVLQIYRVGSDSSGHWVMNVPQTAVDAASAPACVAASPDGRYAVRVWADGNVTIYDGPDHESKVFHNTLKGGLSRTVISTETTYSSTPPGMGCPGYMG